MSSIAAKASIQKMHLSIWLQFNARHFMTKYKNAKRQENKRCVFSNCWIMTWEKHKKKDKTFGL